jgi:hypothetical protein
LAYRSTQEHDKRFYFYRSHHDAAFAVLDEAPPNLSRFFPVLRSLTHGRRLGGVRAARIASVALKN